MSAHSTAPLAADMPYGCHGADCNRGMYRWDPRLKLGLLAAAVALNVGLARLELSLFLFGVGMAMALWSRIPARSFLLFFLAPLWATLMVLIGFSVGFGVTPVWSWGPLTIYHEGLLMGIAAAARVACDMAWLAAVFLTTPFGAVLTALKWFRMPTILTDMLAMAYRYAFLLLREFNKLRDAGRMRGGFRNYVSACRSTAMILAQIILRAYDRAKNIQFAMSARGENASRQASATNIADGLSCPNRCDITPAYEDKAAAVLACDNISYAYGPQRSLSKVSFSVQKGEAVVICGPNGAGKTTLLRLVAGLLVPYKGRISICGRILDGNVRKEVFRQVGIMAQDPNNQLFCPYVYEDVAYGPTNLGLSPTEIEERVTNAMELMEVSYLAKRPIHTLSHGEMKRVGLAGIIAMQPPLILLDEPTAGLDPASARHLVKLIKHLNRYHGYTVVMVTHDIDIAAQVANRIIILKNGVICADGPVKDILTDQPLLMASRLEPPILTQLFQRLDDNGLTQKGIPVTIEEAVALLQGLQSKSSFVIQK